jgi:ubiquinone/menaquinone biosynthesis C-methylase UbiE
MKYSEAYAKFTKAYKDRYTVEFPTIFGMCNFRNKSVLEIGAGSEGFFIKEAIKITKKYTACDISRAILNKLKKNIDVETKVCGGEKLPFADKSFDLVFARWVHFDNFEKAVKEMCRAAKCCVIVVLPSEKGDQTKMMQIKYKNKYKYRKERITKIHKWMKESGFRVEKNKKLLKFVYKNIETAAGVINTMEFGNKLNKEQKQKLEKFLLKRKKKNGIHLTQGACFICAYRK